MQQMIHIGPESSQMVYAEPASSARAPSASADGLPISLQLIGRHFEERTIIALADAFQRATDGHTKHPPDVGMD